VTDKDSFENVKTWMIEVDKLANETVCKLLVGNKADRTSDRKVTFEMGQELAKQYGIPYIETSAKDSTNVATAFLDITKSIHTKMQKQPVSPNGKREKLKKGSSLSDEAKSSCC